MKKIQQMLIVMLTFTLLTMSFAGCNTNQSPSEPAEGEGSASAESGEPNSASPASETSTSTSAADGDFTAELISPNKIIVGISPDYPPYESLGLDGKIEGFDVDMLSELAKYLSEDGTPIEIQFQSMSFESIITALQVGQVDIGVSGFTYDAKRDVLFSTPYLFSKQVVTVAGDSELKTLEDLAAKRIGAGLGTTGEKAIIEQVKDAKITNGEYTLLFESLKNGALDAVVSDGIVAKGYVESNGFTVWEEALIDEENVIITKKGNDQLAAAIDRAIAQFMASDEYTALQKKWGILGE